MAADARLVLVVDDDQAHGYTLGRRLSLAGFKVVVAETGAEAIQLAAGVDAIILDVQLPDMTGFEVCRRLREECALVDLPIIHISAAYVASEDLVHGLSGGADAYLTRPVDDDVVVSNLRAILRLRDTLVRVNQELDDKRRNEERAKDLFMAMLNHDLRGPLDAISMCGQLLARGALEAQSVEGTAKRILAATTRMKHLLNDMQDYAQSRLGSGMDLQTGTYQLGELAKAAIDELLTAHATARVELIVHGTDVGEWDGPRLSRVLTNLLRNAVQHGAQGRPIAVAISSMDGDTCVLTVHNEGAVIPPDVMATLFQPMAPRTNPAPFGSNLGLGLFVCKEIVEAHGGTISISSGPAGTECRVVLPFRRCPVA